MGFSCSLVGPFLVLRRLSLIGDAISHSVLLGIVIAFLFTGSRTGILPPLFAALVAAVMVWVVSIMTRQGQLQEDASIGVAFTSFFAVAIILITLFADRIDLDQECVLYGEIAFAPFDRIYWREVDIGPRSFWMLLSVSIINLSFLTLGYRRLKELTFDPQMASVAGIKNGLWHYLLIILVSLTTVAAFEAVGAILVVAMLVIPSGLGFLVSRSLAQMISMAIAVSLTSSIFGYFLADYYDASISASVVLVSGLLLVMTLLIRELQRLGQRMTVKSL